MGSISALFLHAVYCPAERAWKCSQSEMSLPSNTASAKLLDDAKVKGRNTGIFQCVYRFINCMVCVTVCISEGGVFLHETTYLQEKITQCHLTEKKHVVIVFSF